MRVAIAALGTRGDVQPCVVLGRGLQAAGHDVLISTVRSFQGLVEDASLRFHALPGTPNDVFALGRIDVSPLRPLHHLAVIHAAVDGLVRQSSPELLNDAWADRDCVVITGTTTFGLPVATRIGATCVMLAMTPAVATGAFAHPVLAPRLSLSRRGNLVTWLAGERLARQTFKEPLKPAARRAWGLPRSPLGTVRQNTAWPPVPILHAFSPEAVAPPPDWPSHVSVAGWLLPESSNEPLPDDVERFLAAGAPPLYVGFGSMPVPEPDAVARSLLAALRRTGQRALVSGAALAGARVLADTDLAFAVPEIPHERLLHRVRGVIHHGGSGTTGAGLRAGRPTLTTPFVFDQFFWGERVRALGAGPAPIPFRRLSEDRLTHGIAELASGRFDAAARRLGELMSAEESAQRAVTALEREHQRAQQTATQSAGLP